MESICGEWYPNTKPTKPLFIEEASMKTQKKENLLGEELFAGIDLHKRTWYVTIRTVNVELFCGSIPGKWEALQKILKRYKG